MKAETMMEGDYAPQAARVTGGKVLLIAVSFFAVVLTANMTMLYFALSNFSGLVVKNSYVAGQRFEQDRAAARAAPVMNWEIALEARAATLRLSLTDAAGAPVRGADLTGWVGRRSHDREDASLVFTETAPGVYAAPVALRRGAWRLSLVDRVGSPRLARPIDFRIRTQSGSPEAAR